MEWYEWFVLGIGIGMLIAAFIIHIDMKFKVLLYRALVEAIDRYDIGMVNGGNKRWRK